MDRVTQEDLELEAATAISTMRKSADLDARMGVLKARETVDNDRLAAFIVAIPEGYTAEEDLEFKRSIALELEAVRRMTHYRILQSRGL